MTQQLAPQPMAEPCEAPTLVVLKTQPSSLKTDLQHTILFAEERDHVLMFALSPSAQHPEDELERRHGPKSTSEVVDRWWDTTPHEIRLLSLLAEGHSFKTAAAVLGNSVNTIAFHMKSVYAKLQVHSKSEAVAKALRTRIVR